MSNTNTRRATTVTVKAGTTPLARVRLNPTTGETPSADYWLVTHPDTGDVLGSLEYYDAADEKWTAVDPIGRQHEPSNSRNAALRHLLPRPAAQEDGQPAAAEQQPAQQDDDPISEFFPTQPAAAEQAKEWFAREDFPGAPAEDFFGQFEEQPEPQPEQPEDEEIPVDVLLRTFYVRQTIATRLAEIVKAERPAVLEALLKEWKRTKSKSWEVTVEDLDGDEHKVGTTTLPKTDPVNVVTDNDAAVAWLKANDAADLVERTVIPAREEQVTEAPSAKAIAALVRAKRIKIVKGQMIDTKTGETVPGFRQDPAPDPDKFTAGFGGTGTPGRELILELLEDGDLMGGAIEDLLRTPKAIEAPKK